MTGLAFPTDAKISREASYEDGTPTSNPDDIPIDPALTGALDPVLMAESNPRMKLEQRPSEMPQLSSFRRIEQEIDEVRQYSQTPQGDPFAPQPLPPYITLVSQAPPQPLIKPQKRKRKIRREEECGFCAGTDKRNRNGESERMATCLECGRSGHPSCMELTSIGEIICSYPWRCIECKICEVCQQKGDDARLLFCDHCDRGWHMDCLDPAMTETPQGTWVCPQCTSIPQNHPHPEGMLVDPMYPQSDTPMNIVDDPAGSVDRGTSVASTSQSAFADTVSQPEIVFKPRKGRPPGKKGPGRPPRPKPLPTPSVADEDAMEVEVAEEPVPAPSRSARTRTVKRPRLPDADDDDPAPSPLRSRRTRKPQNQPKEPSPGQSLPRVRLRLPSLTKGKGKEREEEESNSHGMFDDILSETDRDTSKTQITRVDKALFENSRLVAEDKLRPQPVPPSTTTGRSTATATSASDFFDFATPGPSRPVRRASALHHITTNLPGTPNLNGLSASPVPSTPGGPPLLRPMDPKQLRIHTIRFGEYDIKTWYDAPFPEEYATIPDGRLWICEFCLKYMKSRFGALRHRIKCKARHPPGDEIYRDANVSIFEVDGRRNKIYCQNLCLLSKMFLDHKSLFYDVEPFLFYVITELDDVGYRFVGYFSKEKRSPKDYNVSCIMTLPVRQRKGWGNLLIDFSYLLSKKEERSGSPEKPLSALGAIGYRKYWTLAVMRYLQHAPDKVTLEDIRQATSMTIEDICQTLTEQNMLYTRDSSPTLIRPSPGQAIKYPKGRKNGIARRQLQRIQSSQGKDADKGPFVAPKHYEILFDRDKVAAYVADWERKGYLKLKPEKLQWTPYLLSRTAVENGVTNETPAMASTSIAEPSYQVASPNGLEKKESSTSLNLFSSSPGPEDAELGEEDELPMPSMSTRSRTRSPKKSPSKPLKRIASVEDVETPRRTRPPRQSNGASSANGAIFSPDSGRPPRRGRKAALVAEEEEEEEEQTPRSLRARHRIVSLAEPTPKKPVVRKRPRDPSPEPEPEMEAEAEEAEENGVETEPEPSDVSEVNGIADEAASSEFGVAEHGPQHVESDLRSTLVAEELYDEDAEGELDEDAEGEIDPDY